MAEYLVEVYVSRADPDAVALGEERIRLAAEELTREGRRVHHPRAIFVPEDETCFYLFEADRVEDVEEAALRASLSFERILETAATRRNERVQP